MQTFELTDTTRVSILRPIVEAALATGPGVILRGQGNATTKVVSLAELLKRQQSSLRQVTSLITEGPGLEIALSQSR